MNKYLIKIAEWQDPLPLGLGLYGAGQSFKNLQDIHKGKPVSNPKLIAPLAAGFTAVALNDYLRKKKKK